MSKHSYINSAFCEQSEFYPILTADQQKQPPQVSSSVEIKLKNRNYLNNKKCSPAKVHRSESTRSIHSSVTKQQQQAHFVRGGSQRINTQYQPSNYLFSQKRILQSELPPIPGPKPVFQYEESDVTSVLRSSSTVGTRYGILPPTETNINSISNGSGRYALVPVEDIPNSNKGRYAVVPGHAVNQIANIPIRYTKSQDNIDRYESLPIIEEPNISLPEDSFTSLPPCLQRPQKSSNEPKMNHGFSSDFGNKSFVLVDQKSMQRYAIVPTEDDEEIVDDNHEIIQMHNGRPHRYAVIPTEEDEEEEEETCLSSGTFEMSPITNKNFDNHNQNNNSNNNNLSHNYATIKEPNPSSQYNISTSTPQKLYEQSAQNNNNYPYQHQQQQLQQQQQQQILVTPKKNPLATQKLHELLSTPQKVKRQTPTKTPVKTITTTSTPRIINTPTKSVSHHINKQSGDFTPQRLQYEQQSQQQQQQQQRLPGKHKNKKICYVEEKTTSSACQLMEQRTTAVITPRLMMAPSSIYSGVGETLTTGTTSVNKSWNNLSFHKVANATATIGAVSLMLILCGMMNSGVCLYLMSGFGRSYYLDVGFVSGFAATTLGFLGFRSRQCEWLPNRNYISGYILVTVFSLLNCCGLLVLLALHPYPGTPLHDVTTGVILGLSTLTLLLISLGVITSRWCHVPPPDNRVDVY